MANRDKKKKEPKRKPKYGLFSCVGYMYRLLWKYERGLALTGILTVPLSLALSALALYTPSLVLDALEEHGRFSTIALIITGLLLTELLLELANNVIRQKTNNAEHYILMRLWYMRDKTWHLRDWYLQYDPKIGEMDQRARKATSSNFASGVQFPMNFAGLASYVLRFFLFGSVVAMLHPLIILLLAAGCLVTYAMNRWCQKKWYAEQDEYNMLYQKIDYMTEGLSANFRHAKDIRLYTMSDFLVSLAKRHMAEYRQAWRKMSRRYQLSSLLYWLVIFLRDGAAYTFLILKAAAGEVDASQFVLYFSAITSMAEFMSSILNTWSDIAEGAAQLSDYREDLEIRNNLNTGEGIPVPKGPFSIEFRNVSYKYPQGEKNVLENVSFKIKAGEKIALVGLNGAGKTTLTMLMCGLVIPDSGTVLLDGNSIFAYNREEMYSLFGFVPQDFHLMPVSIARNIASAAEDEHIDRDKLDYCIEMAGLREKIDSLPLGAETPLNREVNRNGVDLSGGETQKLLLARLLYRDPPCIILDEPTSALDPIAEDRLYRRYNEITKNATSVFISHRLASTRFCDRIFFLDGANFAEVGTHDELMAAGGKYKELFDIQSRYYREGADTDEKDD